MEKEITPLEVYDKRAQVYQTLYVEKLSEHKFRMAENDIWNCRLTMGTEFEARRNKEGKYQVVRIIKESDFITRRFMRTKALKDADLGVLGAELQKSGGALQVDFGGIITVNLPKDFSHDLDQVITDFDLGVIELVDDTEL